MIAALVEKASVFQSPSDLGALFNAYCASISKHDLFNKPENGVLVEIWMAAMLGLGFRRATEEDIRVRICGREAFPDFRIAYREHDLAFEATTAMLNTPSGKPGIVYRGDTSLGAISSGKRIASPPFDHEPLRNAVRKKAGKHYAAPVHLCVYVTYGGKSLGFDEVVETVAEAGGDAFELVWVLFDTHMTCAKRWDHIGGPDGWVDLPVRPLAEEP